MKKIRWGILGCGRIARKFAADLRRVDDAVLVAVGARSMAGASAFVADFPEARPHASYELLAGDGEVDVIYVATPHAMHYAHTLLCLKHKKAVLCEKPFALNHRQAAEMVAFAQQQKTFVMEAFWSAFLPPYRQMKQLVDGGKVGNIKYIHAEFGFKPTAPVARRLYDPALGGGALLDIGIYPVFLALDLLGKPDHITATMVPAATGIDEQCAIGFQYQSGAIAQLFCSFSTNLASGADISGDGGRIRLTHRFHGPTAGLVYYPSPTGAEEVWPVEKTEDNGYAHEARHVNDCIRKGLLESPMLPHSKTLLLIQTLDKIRALAGITYAADRQSSG